MRACDAAKLHNGDEVIIKKGNLSAKVLKVNEVRSRPHGLWVELEVVVNNGGGGTLQTVWHNEVR